MLKVYFNFKIYRYTAKNSEWYCTTTLLEDLVSTSVGPATDVTRTSSPEIHEIQKPRIVYAIVYVRVLRNQESSVVSYIWPTPI
jgi:hypothetical protein